MEFVVDLSRALNIDGWMSPNELQFLAETAKDKKVIFEIGSYMGRSTRALADNTEGIVYAIDSWKTDNYDGNENAIIFTANEETFNTFYCNLHDLINSGKVIPSYCNWEDFFPVRIADFIFIDGSHRYEHVCHDIDKALKWINSGGIIAGHDYAEPWKGVMKAVNEVFIKPHVVDTIWWWRVGDSEK
jgi:hypothetical protein